MKWVKVRAPRELNWKLLAKKKEFQKPKEHFKNLLGNSPKVTYKPIIKFNCQLDIKLGQLTQELNAVLTKIKNRRNIHWSMEDKDIWWLTSSILQHRIWRNYYRKMEKKNPVSSLFLRKVTSESPRTSKAYLLLLLQKRFIMFCFSIVSNLKLRKFLGKIKTVWGKIDPQHHRF